MRDRWRQTLALVSASLVLGSTLVAMPISAAANEAPVSEAQTAPTGIVSASLSGFTAGNIIEDAVFFNKDSMTAGGIQEFLNARGGTCSSGYTCLKDYRMTTTSRAADAMCRSPYTGRASESAAEIIYNVAQACGINPQVLIVMLQKEQSLVTSKAPSDLRYRAAMGQGCPDTAACDSQYYGFFNQVYGAAWQLKRYANPEGTNKTFTWYAPNRSWNVLYNPNTGCGSSSVYIANQATANLYYYTPYQPNAAAISAGYGVGDGCSSYGNRNFYNYFTDWFGSTRASNVTLVRTESNSAVYLVSGTRRWHVTDGEDHEELSGAFGGTYIVSDAFIAGTTDAGTTSAILRNERTGEIALVQGGQRHRFASCDLVAKWGSSCAAAVSVSDSIFSRLSAGAEMTEYYRVRGSDRWGRLDGNSTVTPLWNEAAARSVRGDPSQSIYGAYLTTSLLQRQVKQPVVFAPAQLVKADNSDRVYLTVDYNRLLWVPSFSSVAEFNRTSSSLAVVSASELSSRYRESGTVSTLMRCDGTTYFAASGYLHALNDPGRAGLASMDVGGVTCAQFSRGSTIAGPLLVKNASSSQVYAIEANALRAVVSWQALLAYVGSNSVTVLSVRDTTTAAITAGNPVADGEVVKGSGADLLIVSGTTTHRVPSYGVASDLGVRLSYVTVSDSLLGRFASGAALGNWVKCAGTIYFGAQGTLYPVAEGAATGFAVVDLSSTICGRLSRSSAQALSTVYVKASGAAEVYQAVGGVYRHVSSMSALLRLNGGTVPTILQISVSSFDSLPKGDPIT